jgi:transcriptional regulator with XRE-family HTH domain
MGDGMRKQGWEERLRELDEASVAFRVARGTAKNVQGWLRTVRREVGITAPEAAARIGVDAEEVYRMERAEGRRGILLRTLQQAAEALGCDLVYGLAPKEGTLAAMAAGIEAGRVQRHAEARARRLNKLKEQRREAARQRWEAQERNRLEVEWREYWRLWATEMPYTARERLIRNKPMPAGKFWKQALRKALLRVMRKDGTRVR